jgi:hypothetical protein
MSQRAREADSTETFKESLNMKKWHWMSAAGVAALGVATMAYAATISNLSGQSCGASIGAWHFVNNQTGGATGTLDVCFSSGCTTGVQPSKVNANNVHFDVVASGALTSAVTTLPGRLVLSHFTCGEPPKCDPATEKCDPPPTCDPKTQVCK